jgi:hypothetical protein
MTVDASGFWKPFEETISSLDDFQQVLDKIFNRSIQELQRTFVWRGVVDAAFPLHSSLFRKLLAGSHEKAPDEQALLAVEAQILVDLHKWGLHQASHGRLSFLEQLAMLQHFGAPTRLIDVTFNAYVALWFAVADQEDGQGNDGRVLAIDVTDRLINDHNDLRLWEESTSCPWIAGTPYPYWCVTALAWRPPPIDRRISAQHGGFLLGGVPTSSGPGGPNQWPKATSPDQKWTLDEVRRFVSVSLRAHKLKPKAGGVAKSASPTYTVRIEGTAKEDIRNRLRRLFGYSHETFFPDFTGFARYSSALPK